jgi:hypothetical protein
VSLLAGCSSPSSQSITPEPVHFDHPDEVVRAGGFMALADRRIFAAMAFANAAGYDEELAEFSMHPVRMKLRDELEKKLAGKSEKLETYRAYYQNVVKPVQLFAYKSYVLSLSSDYPFRRIRPDEELAYPFTAQALGDLPRMLNDFWKTADLDALWAEVKPAYVAEIRKYNLDKMDRQMTFLWEYFRMERRDDSTVVVHVPDLLNRHLGAMGAGYEQYFYSVENPGAGTDGLNIHEYIHSIVNPLIKANYPRFKTKLDAYYVAGKDAPAVAHYQHPVTFAFECMVLALDRRINIKFENDAKWTRLWEGHVAHDTRAGFTLAQPFYDLLVEYERSGEPFDRFLPTLLEHLPAYEPPRTRVPDRMANAIDQL